MYFVRVGGGRSEERSEERPAMHLNFEYALVNVI